MSKKVKATTFIEAWKEEFSDIYPEVEQKDLATNLKETYWDYLGSDKSLKKYLEEERGKASRGERRI